MITKLNYRISFFFINIDKPSVIWPISDTRFFLIIGTDNIISMVVRDLRTGYIYFFNNKLSILIVRILALGCCVFRFILGLGGGTQEYCISFEQLPILHSTRKC